MFETVEDGRRVELLEFHSSGRPHRHKEEEIFEVLEGEGVLIVESEEVFINKGDKVSIPGSRTHYMKPLLGETLKLRVTYA